MANEMASMTTDERETLSRIEAFKFDEGEPALSFAGRLAKDNGWTVVYAARVIEEYRRFAFLMVTADHMAVPSDQVDQAWHQHLLYTRSWSDFCKNGLGQWIHHEPTKGGAAETDRFRVLYQQTLQSYRRFFGEPPDDIWPDTEVRFGRDLHFKRVNTHANVVMSRSWLWAFGVAAAVIVGAVLWAWFS